MPRSRPSIAAAAAAAALLLGCSAGAPRRERLVVAAVRQPATSLFFLAREVGCFDEAGIELEEHTFELGRDALALMRHARADVAIAYETPTLLAALEDEGIRVLTMLHTSTRNTRLVVRRDRGIDGFSALGGRRIGLAKGTNAEFFVALALRLGGVPPARAALVPLSPERSVAALAGGDLDAAVLSDPYATQAELALGDGAGVLQTDLYSEFSLLLTREEVLAARAGALRRLLRGLACAERHARERPEESLRRIGGRFPELDAAELRRQLHRVRWRLGIDHVLMGVLRDEGAWLRASTGGAGALPDLRRLVAGQLLTEVAPDAVMLLGERGGEP